MSIYALHKEPNRRRREAGFAKGISDNRDKIVVETKERMAAMLLAREQRMELADQIRRVSDRADRLSRQLRDRFGRLEARTKVLQRCLQPWWRRDHWRARRELRELDNS